MIQREAESLCARPVWLFSSGPIGDPPKPAEAPPDAEEMVRLTHAREHRTFAGVIDTDRLSFAEKAITRLLRAPAGDFRPWEEIIGWAGDIAATLRVEDARPAVQA